MSAMSLKDLENITLDTGVHIEPAQGISLLEAVSIMGREKFSDNPRCCCPTLAAFARRWNHELPHNERQGLKKYIPQLVGTRDHHPFDDWGITPSDLSLTRSHMAADWLVRVCTPAWLDLSTGLQAHAAALRALDAITCKPTLRAAIPALDAAREAAHAAACDGQRAPRDWYTGNDAPNFTKATARVSAWYPALAAARYAAREAARTKGLDAAPATIELAIRAFVPELWSPRHKTALMALKPVRETMQASAHTLFAQMIAATEPEAE